MQGTKYKYALVDLSYMLHRNCFAMSARANNEPGKYTEGDVIRTTLQTLNKLSKTWGITTDKIIMIYDKWDPQWKGYYTTYLLGGEYKDDRGDLENEKGKGKPVYMTKELFEQMKNDPNVSPDELDEAYKKLYFNEVKYKAKWGMIKELGNFGIPSFGVDGWEFDNLAWLATGMLYDDTPGAKPSIIVTKDSDLQYALSPQMDYFKLPTKGSNPEIITYDKMFQTIPDSLKGILSLYDYKSYLDAMGEGHNGMRKTRKAYTNPETVIHHVLAGDYSDLDDVDLFKKQLSTFNLGNFPRLQEAKRIITDLFPNSGRLGSLQEFNAFKAKYGIGGPEVYMTDQWFVNYISKFDPALYS